MLASCQEFSRMSEETEVNEEMKKSADCSEDLECPEVEDEKKSAPDEAMVQSASRGLERMQYLSDSENEDEEKKEKSPIRVHSPDGKTVLETQSSTGRNGSASHLITPSAVTIKEEPPLSPSAASEDAEDPMEESAFEPMEWCEAVLLKTEACTTPQPSAGIDAFNGPVDDPVEESAPACPVPVAASPPVAPSAVTIKEEPLFFPLAAAQNTEDRLEESASACPVPVAASPPVAPSAVTIKEEPLFFPLAAAQNTEDRLEESASACPVPVAASPPVAPSAVTIKEEPLFFPFAAAQNTEDRLEESASACPVPVAASPPVAPSAVTIKEEPLFFPFAAAQNTEDRLEESASACPVPVAASPPVAPSAVTIKEEPLFFPLAAAQNTEDRLEESASACPVPVAASPPVAPSAVTIKEEPLFFPFAAAQNTEDRLEESASACPVPVAASPPVAPSAVTIKEEPLFFPFAAAQNTEDRLEESASACPVPVAASPPVAPSAVTIKEEPLFFPFAAAQNTEDRLEESASACPVPVAASPPVAPSAVTIKEEPLFFPLAAAQNTEDRLEESASACPVPVAASPPVAPSAVTIKEEPLFFPLAAAQNTEDRLEESASACPVPVATFPPVPIKEEPPPSPLAAVQNSEDPVEESASACPVPVAASPTDEASDIIIKDEPLFFPSSAEDLMENTSFEPKTECSPTPSPSADFDASSKSAFEEPTEDPLEGLAPSQTESLSLPTLAECIITPSGVIKAESDRDNCTMDHRISYDAEHQKEDDTFKNKEVKREEAAVDRSYCDSEVLLPGGQFSSATSQGDCRADPQKGHEALRAKELVCSGDVTGGDWDKFVASMPLPRFKTMWKVRASTHEEKALFRVQERERFENYQHAYTYRLHGYESVVGPIKLSYAASRRPYGRMIHVTNKHYLVFLALVRDAVGRLPNGVGTPDDITVLVSESQYVYMSLSKGASLISKVAGSLALLGCEDNPCLSYDVKCNMCVYLHRAKSMEEFESLYPPQPITPEAKKVYELFQTKDIERGQTAPNLIPCVGRPVRLVQANAQPIFLPPRKRLHPSNSGPQLVRIIDPNGAVQELIPTKLRVVPNRVGSALVAIPATSVKGMSPIAFANGVPTSVSASSMITRNKKTLPLPSRVVSSAPNTLACKKLVLSPTPAASKSGLPLLLSLPNSAVKAMAVPVRSQPSSSSSSSLGVHQKQQQVPGLKFVSKQVSLKTASAVQVSPTVLHAQKNLSSRLVTGLLQTSVPGKSAFLQVARTALNREKRRDDLSVKISPQVVKMAVKNTCKCSSADRVGSNTIGHICGLFPNTKPGVSKSSIAGSSTSLPAVKTELSSEKSGGVLSDAACETNPVVSNAAVKNACTSTAAAVLKSPARPPDPVAFPRLAKSHRVAPIQQTVPSVAAGDPKSVVSVAVVDSKGRKRAACGEKTVDHVAKVNRRKDNSMTDDSTRASAVAFAAPDDFVTLGPSQPLVSEGVCLKCYAYISTKEDILRRGGRQGGTNKGYPSLPGSCEGKGDVPCSVCDTEGVQWVILKHIITWWVHECMYCKWRFMDRSKFSHHEQKCILWGTGLPICLLCTGNLWVQNSTSCSRLFHLGLKCPACRQLFKPLFSFEVYWINDVPNSVHRFVNVHVTCFSCIVCGLLLIDKISLNAHMKKHGDFNLQAVKERTLCPLNETLSIGDSLTAKESA